MSPTLLSNPLPVRPVHRGGDRLTPSYEGRYSALRPLNVLNVEVIHDNHGLACNLLLHTLNVERIGFVIFLGSI